MTEKNIAVRCGDWIYPSKDSSSGVQYPIDYPLVAEIYLPTSEQGKNVSSNSSIHEHLTGPRWLNGVISDDNTVIIRSLRNEHEELFTVEINESFVFVPETLARPDVLWIGGEFGKVEGNKFATKHGVSDSDWAAVFFTSVILQNHLVGKQLPEWIKFRKATMPEVESLGLWTRQRFGI